MTEYKDPRVGSVQVQGAAVADTGATHALDPAALRSEDRTAHAALSAQVEPRVEVAATVITKPRLEDQRFAERGCLKSRGERGRSGRGPAGRRGLCVGRWWKGPTQRQRQEGNDESIDAAPLSLDSRWSI